MSVLNLYFGWPAGAVYSNLIASLICVGVAWWRLRARMIAHHAELVAQAAIHHAERLAAAERHHEELKTHVTVTVAAAIPAPKTLVRKPREGGA